MKLKILGALVIVLGIAGAAPAYPPHHGYGGSGPRGWERSEISSEERARFDEMRKVRYELGAELRKENPNKERARSLFAKELDLRQQLREEGFRNCIENHGHSRGPCVWITRNDARVSYGNGAWVSFIHEMRQEKPNKVRAWEYFREAEKFYRAIELERFDAMLDNPKGAPRWYGGPHYGRKNPRPRGGEGWGPAPRGFGHPHHGFAHDRWGGGPRDWDGPAD